MFENETNKLRDDISLWEELLETDIRQDPKFEEHMLFSFFAVTQMHIDALRNNIPYESLDDPEELADELADDTLEDAEVEDEVVEIERLIDRAHELMELARNEYYPEGLPGSETDPTVERSESDSAPEKQITRRRRRLDDVSQMQVFVIVLLAVAVLIGVIFGD